jgi:hypothetical protein
LMWNALRNKAVYYATASSSRCTMCPGNSVRTLLSLLLL